MKKMIKLEESVGQTVTGVSLSWEKLLLVFGDGYVILKAGQPYDDLIEIEEAEHEDMLGFCHDELIKLGVCSQQELGEILEERKKGRQKVLREREQAEYKRLKEKFE